MEKINIYLILLDSFIDLIKKYENSHTNYTIEKISTDLFHRDKSSLSKFKSGKMKLSHTDFANAILEYVEKKSSLEKKKEIVLELINSTGDNIKNEVPAMSMLYFKDLVDKEGDSYYNEHAGYKKAIADLTYMFYQVSYSNANFAELQARRDKYRSYSINYPKYQKAIAFITNERILPDDVKEFFQQMDGEPVQSLIYNTLIYELSDRFQEDDLIKTMAEIYHYQTLLNYKIGRVMPPSPKMPMTKDDYLMKCILREVKYRHFSHYELPLDFDLNNTDNEPDMTLDKYKTFTDRVFAYYKDTYLKKRYSLNNISTEELLNIIKAYQATHTANSIENLIAYLNQLC